MPNSMRILMTTSDHLMIDRRILQEARTLRTAGYEVEILAGFECPEPAIYEQNGIRIQRFTYDWSDVRVARFIDPLGLPPGRIHSGLRVAARHAAKLLTGLSSFEHYVLGQMMARDFDILHCHDFPMLGPAVEAKRRRKTPLVYDAHELYHAQVQLPESTQRRYQRRERRLIKHADLTITVNPFIAEIMAKDYGCPTPEVLLNAAPLPTRDAGGPGLRQLLRLGEQDRIVMYQGWISPERGIENLVEAARYFPAHVHLVLVGYGDYERELRKMSAAQGTDDGRVIFLGRIEPEDLPPLTCSADLGVIPYYPIDLNHRYSSPNKLFEYAAAGLPFICNDLPFLRKIADLYGFGVLTDLTRPATAASSILDVLENPDRMRELKKSAEQAGQHLNWEVEGQKLLGLYQRVSQRVGGA
jgi:glycosyltransferase involved in cell wall biosynthesis